MIKQVFARHGEVDCHNAQIEPTQVARNQLIPVNRRLIIFPVILSLLLQSRKQSHIALDCFLLHLSRVKSALGWGGMV